ncbi:MAG: efflux RND transporter permease subunit [Calditrichaeota bacterium]|nr:efflux RND transporter permease subunit [Calditrichota bacterium]
MIMLFLSLVVLGVVTWFGIPVQLLPGGFNTPFLRVWLAYPNASPVENMERIGVPVEESFWTIKGVKRIHTRARSNGCSIRMEFGQDIDMDVAYLEARDRLERVKPELPDDFRFSYIYRYSESDQPILYFGISVTGDYEDPDRLVEEEVVKPLERIDGVAKVEMWGGNAKMVRIEFELDKLQKHNVNVSALMRELRNADFAVAGGKISDGGRELLVRADGRISSLDELRMLPVKGPNIRLQDVAEVSYSPRKRSWIQRIDRRKAIQIGVFKESEANTVATADELRKALSTISAAPILGGFDFNILFDQGKLITDSLNNLMMAGLWGGFFAVLVLIYFMRRLRMTLFITLAIPISLMVTVTALYFMGWSLNIITLSGLMICVGLVVDNAIVVVENIQTLKQKGYSNLNAAVEGGTEVGLAITLATLTTAVVFLPLILMSGNRMMAFYMLRIGMPVIIALVASLFVALLFIPLAVNHFALSKKSSPNRWIEAGSRRIGSLVGWVLNHRRDTVLILLLMLSSTSIPMKYVVSTDEEEGNINDFQLRFLFPAYYSHARIDSTLNWYEDYLFDKKEDYDIKTVVTGFRRGYARMQVFLEEPEKKIWFINALQSTGRRLHIYKPEKLTRKEIIEEIKEKLEPPPGVEMFTSWQRRGEEDAVHVSIYGEDTKKLLDLSNDVRIRLEKIEGVVSVETDLESSAEEIQVRFNPEETARYNVDPAQTAYGLNSLIRGVNLPDIIFNGHEIAMLAELREEDRASLVQLLNLPVAGDVGTQVKIGDVADVSYDRGIGEIHRDNGRTRIRLKVVTTEEDIHKFSRRITNVLADMNFPTGYEWGKGHRFQSVEDATEERSQAWLLAITFVLLLMGALFESFFLPWAVIVTVPLSFFGVWWMMLVTGTQFGVMAGIGAIILIGVVVNNAIVLLDKVNRLIKQGVPRDEALKLAAELRFRPILLTALTTIMGLLPMAMGSASLIGIPYAPMGRAIIGGMLTATITTPIVVPLVYSLIDDLKIRFQSFVSDLKE